MIPPIPDEWKTEGRSAEEDYFEAIVDAITNHPRSLQTRIGPSEIGTPCARKLGYKLSGHPERDLPPNWKATIGTGAHAWLETAFDRANTAWLASHGNVGIERYLIEEKVTVGVDALGEPIVGSCDLYDRLTCTVIDHKTVGPTQLQKYRRQGPGNQYRQQAHLYGAGWAARGEQVRAVAVCFLPRNGDLAEAYWWSEPFDQAVADAALQRLHGIQLAVTMLGDRALQQLETADSYCTGCPFYKARSTDLTVGCPGHASNPSDQPSLTLSVA